MSGGAVRVLIILGAVVLLSVVLVSSSCTYVSPGSVGVLIHRTGGGVDETPLKPGFHMIIPFTEDVEEYPISMQTLVLTRNPREGNAENDEINVNSKEGQPISCDVSMSFELIPELVPVLYSQFRMEIDLIAHGFIKQTIRQSMQEVIGTYPIVEFLGERKAEIIAAIQKDIEKKLAPYGFTVRQFTLNEVRVSQTIIAAIEAKNATYQAALQAEQELTKKKYEADQQVATAKGEAESAKARADGEAESIRLKSIAEAESIRVKAKAQAEANIDIAKSLSPELIKYQALLQWDGKLPQVSGSGGVPFISLPKVE
jgi:regulator of protease activity HflC (stomatin/prohibitin superfamily)